MGDLVHRAKVRIVPEKPTIKQAFVDPFPEPIRTGVHGASNSGFKPRSTKNSRPPSTMSSPPSAPE